MRYYFTRFRPNEKSTNAFNNLEIVKHSSVKGFRGFIVQVFGTDQHMKNLTKGNNLWNQVKNENGAYRMWSGTHSIYGRQFWFDPNRTKWDTDGQYVMSNMNAEVIDRGVEYLKYIP